MKNIPPFPPIPHRDCDPTHLASLERISDEMRRRRLHDAIQLAMEAARGEGVLVEHFIELGARFGSSSQRTPTTKKVQKFHIIRGGRPEP